MSRKRQRCRVHTSNYHSMPEGRYAACLERESLPPDYGWPVSGRLVATQISLESMERKNPRRSGWLRGERVKFHRRMEFLRPTAAKGRSPQGINSDQKVALGNVLNAKHERLKTHRISIR